MDNFLKSPASPSTINRQLIENGEDIKEYMKNKYQNESIDDGDGYGYYYADGTKSHSQENDRKKNDIKVAMTTKSSGEKVFLCCNVNKSWDDVNQEINEIDVLDDDAVLVSDAEPGLIKSLTSNIRKHQLDFIHFIRDIGYTLWQDKTLDLDTRKKMKKYAEKIIYTLKNQVFKYIDDKETLKEKVDIAVDKLKEFSEYLHECDCEKAAEFVKKHSNQVVTFAILATEGKDIPWNSNIIERLMGEIQKRCKHKWMRWTTKGQEAILNLLLVRYSNPQDYEDFKNMKLKRKNINNIKIKITS
jgi:hypothetical protein